MNPKLLVDAIVRQTTVLIAQLCTAAGVRSPLAQVAEQVFLGLARELETQGVSRKVAADMFGLALRSYQKKIGRLAESESLRDRTLWEAVLEFLRDEGSVSRRRVFERFSRDDEDAVAAVLNDLVQSGLCYATGRGASALYGLTSEEDRRRLVADHDPDAVCTMVWLWIYRRGPLSEAELQKQLKLDGDAMRTALAALLADGRVKRDAHGGRLCSDSVMIALDEEVGWEAAVFDHYQAVSKAIASKVRLGPKASSADEVGGATLSFDLSPGHPYEQSVRRLLAEKRAEVNELWRQVREHNRDHPVEDGEKVTVTFYLGQNVEGPAHSDDGVRNEK